MLIEPSIIDAADVVRLSAATSQHTIDFNAVDYGYERSKRLALKQFNLTIKPGEKIGLVGYSGSGKTTLTKLLMRFMEVTSGTITIDGIDIRNVAQKQLRQLIAYVPQEPLLFHRSITDNVRYGDPDATAQAVVQAMADAYVTEFIKDLPLGADSLVGEHGIKLSGGQRQRVALARAILKDAPILLLDEATSALDSKSEQYIQKALWKLMKGRTAIVIAHRLSTIQKLDRIVVMDKGKIVQIGSHQDLLEQQGIYAELWSHQSGGYLGIPTEANSTSLK
jgi:ATP-binding cassette subfamily B protein